MVRPAAHSLPHRGSPSTSHTRVRWQPYHSSVQSIPPRSSPLAYLITPASSTSSVSPSPPSLPEPDRPRHAHSSATRVPNSATSKSLSCDKDQAVKSLCDIWPQQDIPTVFLTSGRPMVSPMSSSDHLHAALNVLHSTSRNAQLPSPISPTDPAHSGYVARVFVFSPVRPLPTTSAVRYRTNQRFRPLKFSVARGLQELCCKQHYAILKLSAQRFRILFGKRSFASHLPPLWDQIMIGYPKMRSPVDYDTSFGGPALSPDVRPSTSLLATVRVHPISYEADASFSMEPGLNADKVPVHKSKINPSLPPLPALPSPLLCPPSHLSLRR
ncbi:hypothetical protein J3R82DRAFT_10427 [Butyriboletus roseoflavus]|nr:hypothetical protein J3R82DRAFT_10427 [Butyriboletus roseoflavus]